MPNPLDEHHAAHTLRKTIAAEDYNRVRLALSRISNPLQLELSSMRCLEMLLTDQYWLCFDSCVGNVPILGWTEFKVSDRSALNAPVDCELRLFHMHAGLVMGRVIESLGQELQERLAEK